MSASMLLGAPVVFNREAIDWRRVEDNMEFMCSQVIDVQRLLH
jgi:hypothetical protein